MSPINFDGFIRMASDLQYAGRDSLVVDQKTHQLNDHTSLTGLSKLFYGKAENRATIESFLRSIEAEPAFRGHTEIAKNMLQAKLNKGEPLLGKDVKNVQAALNYTHYMEEGKELVRSHKLPEGHATSYALFAAARADKMNGQTSVSTQLATYLRQQLIDPMYAEQCKTQSPELTKIADRLDLPLTVQETLEQSAKDGAVLSPSAIKQQIQSKLNLIKDRLQDLSPDTLKMLSTCSSLSIEALLDQLHSLNLPKERKEAYTQFFIQEKPDNTQKAQETFTMFCAQEAGQAFGAEMLQQAGLSSELAKALASTPDFHASCVNIFMGTPTAVTTEPRELIKQACTAFLQSSNESVQKLSASIASNAEVFEQFPGMKALVLEQANTLLLMDTLMPSLLSGADPLKTPDQMKTSEKLFYQLPQGASLQERLKEMVEIYNGTLGSGKLTEEQQATAVQGLMERSNLCSVSAAIGTVTGQISESHVEKLQQTARQHTVYDPKLFSDIIGKLASSVMPPVMKEQCTMEQLTVCTKTIMNALNACAQKANLTQEQSRAFLADCLLSMPYSDQNLKQLVTNFSSEMGEKLIGLITLASADTKTAKTMKAFIQTLSEKLGLPTMPALFDTTYTHVSECIMPNKDMLLSGLLDFGEGLPEVQIAMMNAPTPYTRQDFDYMAHLAQTLIPPNAYALNMFPSQMNKFLALNAKEILAVAHTHGNQPLNPQQLWQAVLGQDAPQNMAPEDTLDLLMQTSTQKVADLYRSRNPNLLDSDIAKLSATFFSSQSVHTVLRLAQPKAELTLSDLSEKPFLSSLDSYNDSNAFGLVTDFRRRGRESLFSFENTAGQAFSVHPHPISDAENVPTHPTFMAIKEMVSSMCQTDIQKARVLQAFSQAGQVMPRMFASMFCGKVYSEHGNCSVSAKQNPDNTVTVTITNDPRSEIVVNQVFTFDTAGEQRCDVFSMRATE